MTKESINLDDKEFFKKSVKKMITPYCFNDDNSKIGFKIILDSHNIVHATSILSTKPIYSDFGIETRYINKFKKKWLPFTLD